MRRLSLEEFEPRGRCCPHANLQRDEEYFLVCKSCGAVEHGSNVNYNAEGMAPEEYWSSHIHRTPTTYDPYKYSIRRLDLVCGQIECEIEAQDLETCKSIYERSKKPYSLQATRAILRSTPDLRRYLLAASKFHNLLIGESCGIICLPAHIRTAILSAMKLFNHENSQERWTRKAINVDFLSRKVLELLGEKYPGHNYDKYLTLFKSGVGKKASARNEALWNLCKDIIKANLPL
jgi:hypothetical protein